MEDEFDFGSSFGSSFDIDENDYADVFGNADAELIKEEIKKWINTHCIFCDDVATPSNDNSGKLPEEGVDYELGPNFEINVINCINVHTDENLPSTIHFGTIGKDFYILGQKLTNTNGFPTEVGTSGKGNIWMFDNQISKITDFPTVVHGDCSLRHNKLKSLDGISTEIESCLDVSDNDPDFKFTRTDGKVITIGAGFFGTVSPEEIDKYKSNADLLKAYKSVTGDKEIASAIVAMKLNDGGNVVKSQDNEFIYYSHDNI